ncbi:hypothetical protein C2S51_017194 [Perilla frutescens var. frutescens]|nr:hypothetical protein C2S51_017194 [Perilla frutescens var. frutescens]
MVAQLQERETHLQNPIFDALYCEEERFDEFLGGEPKIHDFNEIHKNPFAFLLDHDFFWEDEELQNLLFKEKNNALLIFDEIISDSSLKGARNEAINWMLKVTDCYGFNASTAVLAVSYYDRFITSRCFQKEKPWMSQLTAVACLSIAAKVEETQAPLLLDLQEKIDDCHKLILEAMDGLSCKSCCKRKFESIPSSPSGVIDAYFSSDSSVDSWAVALSASSSPEPLFKRSRAQEQHMRLAPLSSVSVGLADRTN